MKRRNAVQIGELIRQAIDMSGSTDTYEGQRICYLWPEVVGPAVNRYTTARWVVRDELHVVITSGPIKNEISFMGHDIVRRLNELAGHTVTPRVTRLIVH